MVQEIIESIEIDNEDRLIFDLSTPKLAERRENQQEFSFMK